MIDMLYNGILVILVTVWIAGARRLSHGRAIAFVKKNNLAIAVLLWAAFGAFLVSFVLYFPYFTEIHDIDDAVDSATVYFLHGGNPYVDDVVPRFATKYHPDPEFVNGTYNYLPLDLLVYSGARSAIGEIGAPGWFVLVNLLFSAGALYLFRRIVRTSWRTYVPIAGVVMLFYSFDNASLTLLLMVVSIYFWRKRDERSTLLAIVFLSMATLTKIYAAIPLLVLLLFELQSRLSARDVRRLGSFLLVVAGCGGLAFVLVFPFGVSNVLGSAVLFHTSEQSREETSAGGTLLSEVAMDNPHYALVSIAFVLVAILVSMKLINLDDRILLVMSVFLVVSIKSSLAPLTVLGVYLGSRLYDAVHNRTRADKKETSASGDGAGHQAPFQGAEP